MYTTKLFESFKRNLDESRKLEERRNPENDEVNELIRNSLSSYDYAKSHAVELRKHGIKFFDYGEDYSYLEGKDGRMLSINNANIPSNLSSYLATRTDYYDNDKEHGINNSDEDYEDLSYRTNSGVIVHPDTDLKGFLDSKKHTDRFLPREKDPRFLRNGKEVDPSNDRVYSYLDSK